MSTRKLNEILEAAFMGVERDDACTLHQAELIDHTLERDISAAEWSHAKEIDQPTDWRQVSSAVEYVRDYPCAVASYRRDAELALLKYWGLAEDKRRLRPKIILP